MNYEFHVGDYAAYNTNDGTHTGYVKKYIHPAFSNEYCFIFQWDNGKQLGWSGSIEELPHNFVRIGAYDFTKKEKKKIEQLEKDLPIEMKVGDKVAIMKQYVDGNYNTIIYSSKMIDKINELVDAVNELRDKEDNE